MLEMLGTAQFWVDVLKIIAIDVLLSGDNAVVIALACRSLPERQRKQGVLLGMVGAVALRIVLTFFAVGLLTLPYLKLAGALMLLWIGIKLILPEDEEHGEGNVKAHAHLWGAVKTIIIAVVFSAGVGVFFGFYPARKASSLNPIDALRYE